MNLTNCWETRLCGRAPLGATASDCDACRAVADTRYDGINGGTNGGRICWAVPMTKCGGKLNDTVEDKLLRCLNCGFRLQVYMEQGAKLVVVPTPVKPVNCANGSNVLIRVSHGDHGDIVEGYALADRVRASVRGTGASRIALMHDASHMHTANTKYHHIFTELERELGDRLAFVAAVYPDAFMLVMARAVHAACNGTELHFYPTVDAAVRDLSHHGFQELA